MDEWINECYLFVEYMSGTVRYMGLGYGMVWRKLKKAGIVSEEGINVKQLVLLSAAPWQR